MASIMDAPVEKLKNTQLPVLDYPTPQVDVRGFILNENDDILLVQEKSDKKWALPGGWADIGLSPSENVIKEVKEESGLEVEVIKLLAVYDKKCHPHRITSYNVCYTKLLRLHSASRIQVSPS